MPLDPTLEKELDSAADAAVENMRSEIQDRRQLDGDELVDKLNKEQADVDRELLGGEEEGNDDSDLGEADRGSEQDSIDNGEQDSEEGSEEEEGDSDSEDGNGEEGKEGSEEEVEISDATIERAIRAGIALSDAITYPSEDALIRNVMLLEEQQERIQELHELERRVASGEKKTKKEEDLLADFPEIDEEEISPEIAKALKAMKGIIKKQQDAINDFRSSQETSEQQRLAEATREAEQWFDRKVGELGDQYTEALGKGGYDKLLPGSSQRAKRDAIANQIVVLASGYRALGQPEPSRDVLFDQAFRSVMLDDIKAVGEKKIAEKLKSRKGSHIRRASSSSTKPKIPPDEEIASLIDQKFGNK